MKFSLLEVRWFKYFFETSEHLCSVLLLLLPVCSWSSSSSLKLIFREFLLRFECEVEIEFSDEIEWFCLLWFRFSDSTKVESEPKEMEESFPLLCRRLFLEEFECLVKLEFVFVLMSILSSIISSILLLLLLISNLLSTLVSTRIPLPPIWFKFPFLLGVK